MPVLNNNEQMTNIIATIAIASLNIIFAITKVNANVVNLKESDDIKGGRR